MKKGSGLRKTPPEPHIRVIRSRAGLASADPAFKNSFAEMVVKGEMICDPGFHMQGMG